MAIDYADANGVSLRYALGGARAPTLVLLHEMGGTLETWDGVVARLGDWQALRYDMRGAGLSEKIRDLTIDDLVGDLAALLDVLEVRGPLLIAGIAVGAALAVRFAVLNPDRVAGLLLMALATGIPAERRDATVALARQIADGGLRARVVARLPATFPKRFRGEDGRLRSARGRALSNDPISYAAYYRMLLDLDLGPDLARIACPTLVLAGTLDGTRPPEAVAREAARIPGARFEAVESGHVMPMLTPDLVVDRLSRVRAWASGGDD